MGWFDEQIRLRIREDEESFSDAFANMSSVVMGARFSAAAKGRKEQTKDAIDEILKYYHVKLRPLPDGVEELDDQLEYLLRPSGIMRRCVTLTEGWYKDAVGALLCQTESGAVVAALPDKLGGYSYYDYDSGQQIRVNRKTADNLTEEAICFYRPLPLKALGIKDLLLFIVRTLSLWDIVLVAAMTLAVTLVGLLVPYVNNLIFSNVVTSGQMSLLLPITTLLVGVTISMALLGITKSILLARVQTKMGLAVEAAAMMRTLSLPTQFFRDYSAGELSSRTNSIQSLASMLADAVLTTGLTSVFSLVYIGQIFKYAPALVIPALCVILVTVLYSLFSTLMQMNISTKIMKQNAQEQGLLFALISGVQKIKLSGSERRVFSRWANAYSKTAKLQYDPPAFVRFNSVITAGIGLVGTIVIYYFAVASNVNVADYMAFNVSYGMVSGAFSALASIALTAANIRPVMEMVKPILSAVPEVSEDKRLVSRLSGNIELNNVSFRYRDDMPMVLDDLSLKIRAGQYIAVVGRTGCGKSTLIRLLLGFENPQKGAVYYDGQDLASLDARSVRRHIGVVLQDGKLFPGDIYSNITISAPWLPVDDAWEAAEMAGIAEDIRLMPMGMHTLISGSSGGISGGQAQRLMIARAIAPKPKVLIFDEATSALDNITQKKVSQALDALKCTRIVVAHRLSTIRQCNRIIVLDEGHIVQDGTFESLMQDRNGMFYELVQRQQVEPTTKEG